MTSCQSFVCVCRLCSTCLLLLVTSCDVITGLCIFNYWLDYRLVGACIDSSNEYTQSTILC